MYHEFRNNSIGFFYKIDCNYVYLNSINIDFYGGISIIHINVRSLVNNYNDIILLLDYCIF